MTMDPHEPAAPTPVLQVANPAPGAGSASTPGPVPGPVPVVAVRPRAKSGGILNILLVGAAILAVGGVAFAVGRSTAQVSSFQRIGADPGGLTGVGPNGSFTPGKGGPGGPTFAGGGLSMDGTVKSISSDSVTLTLANGNEVTIKLDGATTYHQATTAAATDVAVGDTVSVKMTGNGRVQVGSGGAAPEPSASGAAPALTASDVTVSR